MQKQSFIRGTIILSASALLLKVTGFVYNICLSRSLGAEGIGLLMMAHPLVPLVITLTELGLPVAISKLVSEANMRGDSNKIKRILVVSLAVTGTLSIILTVLALFGAKYIASIFLTDHRAFYAMLAITPIAPIVAIAAVLKGCFRGMQHMRTIASAEVLEHIVRMVLTLALVQLLVPYGIEYAAAGAMVCTVVGEGAGLMYLFAKFKKQFANNRTLPKVRRYFDQGKQTLMELLYIGLPTTGNGFIHSIFGAFLPMLVTKSLMISGMGSTEATKQYGLLFGYAFPLLFLPGFVTSSLSTTLIPAISEAKATGNGLLLQRTMEQAMQIGLFVGTPTTIILYLWATPLSSFIYSSPEAGTLVKLLAPIYFFHYFEAVLQAVLVGLGRASTVMWNHMITSLFEAAAIFIFACKLGILGVSFGLGFSMLLLTFLQLSSVSKSIGLYIDARIVGKTFLSAIIMVICGLGMHAFMQRIGFSHLLDYIAAIAVSFLTFFMAMFTSNAFRHAKVINNK